MFTLDHLLALIQAYGLWLLGPFAIIEGPIVTVIAAYIARMGYMNVYAVYAVCVVGDLVGDAMYYGIGRLGPKFLPERWLAKMGMTEARQISLGDHFAQKGGRTLLFGKWTHSTGLPIMLASGMARIGKWPRSTADIAAWMLRDALLPGLWVACWASSSFEWRGTVMTTDETTEPKPGA